MPKCECGICRDCIRRKQKREEYQRHREAYIARASLYQRENKEQTNRKNLSWKQRNPDKVKAQWKRSSDRRRGTEKRSILYRAYDLRRNYRVTPEWWDTKFEEQGKACGICGATENTAKNRRMHVDHSHISGQNRGILCHTCNAALERMESMEDWAAKAQAYLDRYEKEWWDAMNKLYEKQAFHM